MTSFPISSKKWRLSQKKKGLCTQCNQPLSPDSTSRCEHHLLKERNRHHRKSR